MEFYNQRKWVSVKCGYLINAIGHNKLSPSIVGKYKNEEALNVYYFNCAAKVANKIKCFRIF